MIAKALHHLGDLKIFKSYSEYFIFASKVSKLKGYFEKFIKGPVIKAYVIDGNVFFKKRDSKYKKNQKLIKYIKKVGEVLDLEVYSLDCIKNKDRFLIIDVNSAPAFMGCTAAYNNFIKYLTSQLTNNGG